VYYPLLYDVVDRFAERRTPYRDAHLKLARTAAGNGELLLAGAFADPADGAAFVFKAADHSVAERFAANDPYVAAKLVTKWTLRKWTVMVGGASQEISEHISNGLLLAYAQNWMFSTVRR